MKFVNFLVISGLSLSAITGCQGGIAQEQEAEQQRLAQQDTEWWQVENVHDGDTIRVTKDGQSESIRLCGIDAPELEQPLGEASRDHLQSLIAQSADGEVGIVPVERDRYGRLVAEIFVPTADGMEIHANSQMVTDGMAYVYERYVGGCPNASVIEQAEAQPKTAMIGVWQGEQVPPWEYRQQ